MKTSPLFLTVVAMAILSSLGLAQTVTISATDASAAETQAGIVPNTGNIQLSRTGSIASALTVWVKVSGLAVQGVDYAFGYPIGTTIVIPAGSSSVNIPVTPIDDWAIEGTEDVRIKLDDKTGGGAAVPYIIGAADRAIVNIADNEDPLLPPRAVVNVVALDASGTETPGGTDPAIFRINRTNNLAPALTVLYALGGTATAGVDYTTPPATITIPAGAAFVDVPIVPIDDPLIESVETVTFTLLPTNVAGTPTPPEAYAVDTLAGTASATIFSEDVPPPPALTITAPGTNGAAAVGRPMTVTFTASAADGYIVSYFVSASGGTTASGATSLPASTPDGTPFNGTATVTFNGSGSAFALLTVQVTNNLGVTATATRRVYIFVAPPDPPQPPVLPIINIYALDANGAEVAAGAPNVASFRVTHDFPATATVGFLFAIGGTAREGIDYTLSSIAPLTSGFLGRWFTFPAGTTEAIIDVNPIDDLLIESAETVTMSLYTPPFIGFNEGGPQGYDPGTFGFYYGPNYTATVNLLDNDTALPPFPLVVIAATDPVGTETLDGSDPAVFTVTRTSGPTDVPLTVNYALTIPPKQTIYVTEVRPAMAANGVDFPLLPGTVTIPAGATSADIVIVPAYDLTAEVSELLQITLRPSVPVWPASGGYVIDDQIVANVNLHDAVLPLGTPVVSIRALDAQAFESAAPSRTATFLVQRSGSVSDAITVGYAIGGSATNGVDYDTLPGSVTIPAGSASAPIVVNPIADGVTEDPESVALTLQPPPLTTLPPSFILASASATQISAGASLRDIYTPPLTRLQRVWLWRHRHFAVQRFVAPVAVAAAAPPPAPALPVSYAVEASTDLVDWEQIGTVDPGEDTDEFVDVNAGDFPSRFYRFRELP